MSIINTVLITVAVILPTLFSVLLYFYLRRQEQPDQAQLQALGVGFTKKSKVALVVVAWGLALLAVAGPNPFMLPFLWGYPFGLVEIFKPELNNGPYIVIPVWLIYISLTVYIIMQKDRSLFFLGYIALVALLVFNTAGCHQMMAHSTLSGTGTLP